ncbi:uncharacterized protein LOC123547975 [Mercenaria mercenaria]|uniref:uncharacterized protein LOC123547975 n=1 Tax=Mercenaria mercenaria TaxID=6596 RepID=UPI00234F14EB|nr:uncharacterized protein LOC123547975 [Mercenaria mercenaria]
MLLQLLIAPLVKLPNLSDLLIQKKVVHSNSKFLNLTAWRLSTSNSKQRGFLRTLENFPILHGELELKRTINANLGSSVAGMLKQHPFEPMEKTSLKYVTYKIAFLVAITTFRRCGDLQSLKLDENSMNVQKKGVTFIRHGMVTLAIAHSRTKILAINRTPTIQAAGCLVGADVQSTDLDECNLGISGCEHQCRNTVGSYVCSCKTGYTLAVNGRQCEDIDECAEDTALCKGYCTNNLRSYTCYCSSGFILEGDDYSCKDLDECAIRNGNCDQQCINEAGSHRCECYSGYRITGENSGSVCKECKLLHFTLMLNTNLKRTFTSFISLFTDIDECSESSARCTQICNNTDGSYTCSCNLGYYLDTDGYTCMDTNDCEGVTCENGGYCVDSLNSYTCICEAGFRGQHCETDINECDLANGGCQDICINTEGSFQCNCSGERELQEDGVSCAGGEAEKDTVFKRLEIPRQLLPKPCFTVQLVHCTDGNDIKIYLASTSEWYRLTDDTDVMYTLGIVFVEVNDLSIPMSLKGIEVTLRNDEFVFNYGVQYGSAQGTLIENDLTPEDCRSFELVEADFFDFTSMDSFMKTFLLSLFPALPDWLRFEKSSTEILSVQNLRSDLIYGRNMERVSWCTGAPVLPDHLYTVFRFDTGLTLSVMGSEVDIPKSLNSRKFCLIVDLCHSYGGTVFLMIPEESRNFLLDINIFQTLKEEQNIHILPRGIGISLVNGINANYHTLSRQLWNGDLMFKPLLPEVGFWIGGSFIKYDEYFTIDGNANIYLAVPSVQTMMTSIFREEWTGLVDIQLSVSPVLRFKLFGKDYSISLQLVTASLNTYISIGDPLENPLEEINFNITHDILKVDKLLNNTVSILDDAIDNIELALSEAIKAMVVEIKESIVAIKNIITINFNDLLSGNFEEIKGHLEDIRPKFYQMRSAVYNFADETEFIVNEAKDNFTNLLESHVKIIEEKIVYSKGDLFRCSRFEEVKQLLDGENALRVLGRAYQERDLGKFLTYQKGFGLGGAFAINSKNVILHLQAFVNMLGIKATGDLFISKNGIYFYLEGNIWDIFLAQIEVTAEIGKEWYQLTFNLRGRFVAKARRKRHLQEYTEDTAMQYKNTDVFRQARERRQVQSDSSSFQGSYLDGLKKAIRLVSQEAQKRLSQAQAELTSAQSGLTKAQNWLDEKQMAVRDANIIFDNVVEKLERAKEKLEAAKGPLKEAIKKLEDAQISVDNLCRIRTCSKICIPGIKCKICHIKVWGVKIPYPCCRFTSCMISFPNPLCVLANLACRIIRAAAYILLEIAKIFVRAAMLAFDVAKAAVTVTQFIVDKSRVVLVVAEGILELAKIGLEVAKGILEAAKGALEAVKLVIGAAFKVLEFVIEYGLKSIIEVRNCEFNIELSTHDLPAFEVSCEVNAFRLGWTEIKLKINFKNILQSIWQAARATIKAIIDIFDGIFSGRKRRDIEFDGASRMHVLLRKIRESDGLNNADTYLNETINIINNITGFRDTGDSDSENRIELFREKCITITVIQDFMQDAFDSLQGVVNESKSYIDEIDNVKMQLQEYTSINVTTETVTADSVGISTEYAANDYNMTEEDIDKAINDSKAAAADDPLLNEIQSAANISVQSVDAETKAVESVNYQSAWFSSMKNMTRGYFNESECENFQDCIFYAISSLYVLYESEDLPNITFIQESILELESILIETFQNESSSIMDTSVAMEYVVRHINNLVSMNLFCSKAPQFLTRLKNLTALNGSEVQFYCHVTGDPEPDYTWLKNDTIIPGEISSRITITNVTERDTFDKYNCVAENVVANVTSNDGYITVVLEDEDECLTEGSDCKHYCNNTIGSYTCSCYNGYMLEEDGISCSDLNECNEDNGGCKQTCNNTEGSFTCSCNTGYQLDADRRTCNDINECLTNNGGCQHTCSNLAGTLACVCNDGFELNIDEKTCNDINECLTNDGGCQHKCINEEGSFTCSCDDGYELHTDRTTCIDINECLTNDGGCQHK